jgi:uncharacterized protein YbjT (DUF2867 family)
MAVVVVTGATGALGHVLVPALLAEGHHVRAMTRTAGKVRGAYEVVADVLEPSSLGHALEGADAIVHLASNPKKPATEVTGVRNVLAARPPKATVLYLSIVGCDRTPFAYYRAKTAAEALVHGADDAFVVRATQFHGFARFLTAPRLLGRSVVPRGARLQPVAEEFVAQVLVEAVNDPAHAPAEVGGPEQMTMAEIAHRAHGSRVVAVPMPGRLVAAIRHGSLLAGPDARLGGAPLST